MSDQPGTNSRLRRTWNTWAGLWNYHEVPWSLALIRIGVVLCLLWDLSWVAIEDLVVPLWGPAAHGGWGDPLARSTPPWIWQWLPAEASSAWIIWATLIVSLVMIGLGLLPRIAVIVFVLMYAQTAQIMDDADRGIDTMMRNVLLILWWSPAWDVLSVRAWWRTGSLLGDGLPKPAWARHLLIVQLIIMYWGAGITKTGLGWMPWGGATALYYILHDPAVARFDLGTSIDFFYPLTQLATVVTIVWEHSFPLMFLFYWYRHTADRPGRLRAWCLRNRPEYVYIALGAIFHVLIGAGLNLGIFPFAMLALYPAWVAGVTWDRWLERRAA